MFLRLLRPAHPTAQPLNLVKGVQAPAFGIETRAILFRLFPFVLIVQELVPEGKRPALCGLDPMDAATSRRIEKRASRAIGHIDRPSVRFEVPVDLESLSKFRRADTEMFGHPAQFSSIEVDVARLAAALRTTRATKPTPLPNRDRG